MITSPAGGSEVIEPIDVVGTATDTNFLKYELALAWELGRPIIAVGPGPNRLGRVARRAVSLCPRLALLLEERDADGA